MVIIPNRVGRAGGGVCGTTAAAVVPDVVVASSSVVPRSSGRTLAHAAPLQIK